MFITLFIGFINNLTFLFYLNSYIPYLGPNYLTLNNPQCDTPLKVYKDTELTVAWIENKGPNDNPFFLYNLKDVLNNEELRTRVLSAKELWITKTGYTSNTCPIGIPILPTTSLNL